MAAILIVIKDRLIKYLRGDSQLADLAAAAGLENVAKKRTEKKFLSQEKRTILKVWFD